MTVSQAAAATGRSAATIRVQFDAGVLVGVRDSRGHRLIDPASLNRPHAEGLRMAEACQRLGCSAETVRRWFDAGVLTGHRDHLGRRRIDPASVDAALNKRRSSWPR